MLSTYTLEEYLQYESVDPTLIELIETQSGDLKDALALNETLEGKLSEIEGEIATTYETLYYTPRLEWQPHTLLRGIHTDKERVEILLKAIKTIKDLI